MVSDGRAALIEGLMGELREALVPLEANEFVPDSDAGARTLEQLGPVYARAEILKAKHAPAELRLIVLDLLRKVEGGSQDAAAALREPALRARAGASHPQGTATPRRDDGRVTPSPQGRTKAFVGPLRQRLATFVNAGPARQTVNTRQWASDRAGDLERWAEVLEQLGPGRTMLGSTGISRPAFGRFRIRSSCRGKSPPY